MQTQLLVIGAGTGGLRIAVTAAHHGIKTVLVGKGQIAGTCLNNGCIPTKAMLHAADVYRAAKNGHEVGIMAKPTVDFEKLMNRVRSISAEGRSHARGVVKNTQNLTYIQGEAKCVGKNTFEVNNTRITADKVFIATGTRPFIPPIPGLQDVPYSTNIEAVKLTKQPKHVLLIGGGYIACEYATFFASIGCQVTIVERAPDILTVLDVDLSELVRKSLETMGVRILTGVATTKASHKNGTFTLSLAGGEYSRVQGDLLLVAAGRIPNTETLHLENTGVQMGPRGYIPTNAFLQSNQKSVYAIGDVNGTNLFAHAAKREGWLALEHAFLHKRVKMPSVVPWAVFTHPVVAGIGQSETELQKAKISYEVLEASFFSCGKARIICEDEGKVKILHKGGTILGAFAAGPQADVIIHECIALMHLGPKAISTLREMIHIHPTLSEIMENLRER